MRIIKTLENIREAQTIENPNHYHVKNQFPDYTAGWVTAYYDYKFKEWRWSYCESREEALAEYDKLNDLCNKFPEVFDRSSYSNEMFVYKSSGYTKAKWALTYMLVE